MPKKYNRVDFAHRAKGMKYVFDTKRRPKIIRFYTTPEVKKIIGCKTRELQIMRGYFPVYEDKWNTIRYPGEWVQIMIKWYDKFQKSDYKLFKSYLKRHYSEIRADLRNELKKYGKV